MTYLVSGGGLTAAALPGRLTPVSSSANETRGIMFAHPDGIGQLARQHHNQMITDAGQRQLRHRLPRTARSRPLAGASITRRLSAAIARAGVRAEPAGLAGRAGTSRAGRD
jgi:hypothetical protein